jgi:hypothetical protein
VLVALAVAVVAVKRTAEADQGPGIVADVGGLVLFRVPRAAYDAGPLELIVEDPGRRGSSGELILSP